MSLDEGDSWSKKKLVYDGPSAYSDLVLLSGEKVGLLYEAGIGHYNGGIAFKSIAVSDIK